MAFGYPDVAPGTTFQGRYEILRELGRGGFNTVYEARQTATGQHVAVKVLELEGGSSGAKRAARFEREMRLCAKLHHPNIMRLIDSGQVDHGFVYTVFEYAPGETLKGVLTEEGALEPVEARHMMLQVLDALSCAHAYGVIHRDIKPDNIMVVPTGARRNALVLDFGIGALADDEGQGRITASNEVIGTPGYAAPEQLRGLRPTSPRSDVFSWGLVFLECLTGRPVFRGSLRAMIAHQLDPEPIRLPLALQQHPLGEVLRPALIKDLEAREVTARDLLYALEACDVHGLRREELAEGPSPEGADDEPPPVSSVGRVAPAPGNDQCTVPIPGLASRTGAARRGYGAG